MANHIGHALARRTLLGTMFGAGVALDSGSAQDKPVGASIPTNHVGLVSILDFVPSSLHAGILDRTDVTTDHTAFVQKAFDSGARLWAPAIARFNVSKVSIVGLGRFFDLNNAQFVGIATAPTSAVVELKCGHSEIRGMLVTANHSLAYRCAVHMFTDDVSARYVGYNRFSGGQADGARIGLLIGGLPEQTRFLTGRDPSGSAVDAPISETTFSQWNMTGCICGVYMNQPNGKLQFLGCHIAGESNVWRASDTPRRSAAAIIVANPGSEVAVVGGSVEQLQEPLGRFVEVTDGVLVIADAAIEAVCPSYVAGGGRLTMARLLNGGHNSATRAFIEARADCTGSITLSDFRLSMPPANNISGTNDLVTCTEEFGGRRSVAPGLLVDLANLELREPRWSGGGDTLYPLVRGARVRMRQCRFTRFTSDGLRKLGDLAVDDRGDRLGGVVDRSFRGLPPFAGRGAMAVGGWQVASAAGGRWGKIDGGGGREALRLSTSALPVAIESAPFPIDRDRLLILRAACRFGASGKIVFQVTWSDFGGNVLGKTILFEGPTPGPMPADAFQWLTVQTEPPAGAERASISFGVSGGGDLSVLDPNVT